MAQNLPLISPNKFKFNPDNLYPKGEQHGTEHCGKLYLHRWVLVNWWMVHVCLQTIGMKTTRSTWIPSATSSDSPESIHKSIHSFFDLKQINISSKYWTSVTRCWGSRCFLRMARPLIDRQCADKNIHGQCYTSGGHHNRASVLFAPINSSREKCQSFEMILTEIL